MQCHLKLVVFGVSIMKIENMTDEILDTAFCVNENPTWQNLLEYFGGSC